MELCINDLVLLRDLADKNNLKRLADKINEELLRKIDERIRITKQDIADITSERGTTESELSRLQDQLLSLNQELSGWRELYRLYSNPNQE